jgi:hypothetical protein
LTGIFGRNLLDDPEMEDIYQQLKGNSEIKPFECIGTVDEVNLALDKAISKYPPVDLPYLLRMHREKGERKFYPAPGERKHVEVEIDHYVPGKYLSLLNKML